MPISSLLSTAVSGLIANAARVGSTADNVVNVNTPGYAPKDIRTTTLSTEQTSRTTFVPGGVQTTVIQEDGPTELATQFTRLIRSRSAFSASAELVRTGDEIQRELVDIKA